MATALHPRHDGPWYLAPETAAADQPPESLAIPVALWSEGRRPGDGAYTAAAAASLARLTHRDDAAISAAVLAALAAQHSLATGDAASLRQRVGRWVAVAAACTGIRPPSAIVDTVLAAAAHPGDREPAARAAQLAGGLPPLARALAGGRRRCLAAIASSGWRVCGMGVAPFAPRYTPAMTHADPCRRA